MKDGVERQSIAPGVREIAHIHARIALRHTFGPFEQRLFRAHTVALANAFGHL
jgi:hypothetical protein